MLQDSTLPLRERHEKSWFALDSLRLPGHGWLKVCVLWFWIRRISRLACQAMDGSRQQQTPCTHTSAPTSVARDGAGIVAFTRRPIVGCPLLLFSNQRVGTLRLNTVPCLAPLSSLDSSSSIFSQLPVWPSPGRLWPPLCRSCGGLGVGSSGFCGGVSRCQSLPRGRSQGGH